MLLLSLSGACRSNLISYFLIVTKRFFDYLGVYLKGRFSLTLKLTQPEP